MPPSQRDQVALGLRGIPTPPTGETIARYDTYLEAQAVVDYLSDQQFPVQFVTIVGSDLRMVERVTGRFTYGRAAFMGALSGAWFGLFVGLLLSMVDSASLAAVFSAMGIGLAFGMLYGLISYSFTGGRRDFISTSQIVAKEYQVLCMSEHADAARSLVHRFHHGNHSDTSDSAGAPASSSESARDGATPDGSATLDDVTASPAPGDGTAADTSDESPTVTPEGPTYGEMIAKKRAERVAAVEASKTEQTEQ